jgi:hypothetical protein
LQIKKLNLNPLSMAQTKLESDSAIAFRLPTTGSIKAEIGACPMDVAIPSFL